MAVFAGTAIFVLARRLMGRSGKLRVAATAASAARNDDALVGARKIVDDLACVLVVDDRAHGHFKHNVLRRRGRFFSRLRRGGRARPCIRD